MKKTVFLGLLVILMTFGFIGCDVDDESDENYNRGTPGLRYSHSWNYCSVSMGTATATDMVIPAVCPERHDVKAIQTGGFKASGTNSYPAAANITSVIIPNTVTQISAEAFADCANLTSVIIGNNVEIIDSAAFDACTNLLEIKIPASVYAINRWAFSSCTSLTRVTFEGNISWASLDTTAFGQSGWSGYGYIGDLRSKYLNGGIGTYTRDVDGTIWTKQP